MENLNEKRYISNVLEYVERVHGKEAVEKMLSDGEFVKYAKEYNQAYSDFVDRFLVLGRDAKEMITKVMGKAIYDRINAQPA